MLFLFFSTVLNVFYCVCSISTRCSVLPPPGWRRLWSAGVASVSSLSCSCPFTYRSSRLPVWVRIHDPDSEHHDTACDWCIRHTTVNRRLISTHSLCFRSVNRASGSNIKPLQIFSSTASRCSAFFFFFFFY